MVKNLFIFLLYPFSLLYGGIVAVIHFLYDRGVFKTQGSPVFSIGVGNLTVGGTGKTPHIEYLITHFLKTHDIATLSRGYGRKTKGYLPVSDDLGPELVGDEPWQFFLKFGKKVKVNVGEKRVQAAQQIHALYPHVNVLLMDDVFQHRAIKPDYSILLCDYTNPFFKDYPFPAGRLREFRGGARRADAIVVSKCPASLSEGEKEYFREALLHYAPGVDVFFSTFEYGQVIPVGEKTSSVPTQWVLVTGIANPKPLVGYLQMQNRLLSHMEFADHHAFSPQELERIVLAYKEVASSHTGILLTEKDYARLDQKAKERLKGLPLFYIPIAVRLLENEDFFWQKLDLALEERLTFSNK